MTETRPATGTARVLVVDDEPAISTLLSATLRLVEFDVRVADTGHRALLAVEEFEPDLVLLDVMLPDLNGFDVARRLRAAGSRVPVLFLSARHGLDDRIVESGVYHLRRKIDNVGPPLIHTVRGVGYALRVPRGDD
ncbi:response regulator [Actinoplanes sp. M2I2]|uniref:response regulator n=1 Tax=Actinoplanes sp. M2I2 TaxID=1734444 RepID=UPI0024C3E7CA|nr:response regulator [Actinoplanes sp. M2I2]